MPKIRFFKKQSWHYVRWFYIKDIDCVNIEKNKNFKIFDFSSPGGVLRVLFFTKLATRFRSKPLQAIFWHRIVAHVFADILIPNFGPAGTRVMWFHPFENCWVIKKSPILTKIFNFFFKIIFYCLKRLEMIIQPHCRLFMTQKGNFGLKSSPNNRK